MASLMRDPCAQKTRPLRPVLLFGAVVTRRGVAQQNGNYGSGLLRCHKTAGLASDSVNRSGCDACDSRGAGRRRDRLLFAGDGAVADIAAVLAVLPADLLHALVGALLCGGDSVAQGGDTQYAAAAGEHLVAVRAGAGVEYFQIIAVDAVEALDHVTLAVIVRVTAGRHDHAQ